MLKAYSFLHCEIIGLISLLLILFFLAFATAKHYPMFSNLSLLYFIIALILLLIFRRSVQKFLQIFTILLRYIWLVFPGVLFLFIAYKCFWSLSQGKDLLITSLENPWRVSVLWVSVVFWVFTTWYSSRILVYKKAGLYTCGEDFFKDGDGDKMPDLPIKGWSFSWFLYKFPQVIGYHLPRFMGYLCFSIITLAYWQLPVLAHPLSGSIALLLLLVYVVLYAVLGKWFERIGGKIISRGRNYLIAGFWVVLFLFVCIIFLQYFIAKGFDGTDAAYRKEAIIVMVLTGIIQQLFLFVVANRRHLMKNAIKPSEEKKTFIQAHMSKSQKLLRYILRFVDVPYEERTLFFIFNVISVTAIVIYLLGVINMHFAMSISSANFAILAFGILVGYFGVVSIFSIHFRINFHIIIFILVIIFGYSRESHYARLVKKDDVNLNKQRPDLKTYFLNWAQYNKTAITSAKDTFPLFFELADGGASRSGYWGASVLGKIHDETQGKFDEHLFCLSGASGGSVGNATYFNLLYNKGLHGTNYTVAGQQFLKYDFLSYTLARMLGPDFFRPLLPLDLKNMNDRTGALEKSMEVGIDDTVFLANKFATQFSAFTPDTLNHLPIICINTTRMQDGRPGVISNIKIQDSIIGKRIDVINLLKHDTDMRMSTAMIMGARFPYVSPAARIDEVLQKKNEPGKDSVLVNYFVDGGYFDNSGAGVVHEMIIGLQEIIEGLKKSPDSLQYQYLNKLKFYVIHITNSPAGTDVLKKVHPISNDLMAPISTLVGSYGTQTDVNDSRLQKYLELMYRDTTHYCLANLYYGLDSTNVSFPMNWSISYYYQKKMNTQLDKSMQISQLISWIKEHAK